jgi:GNAT superfamily N-acetyltransferase
MSLRLVRTKGLVPAYVELIRRLDAELRDRYGEAQDDYQGFNQFVPEHLILAFDGDIAVGCGCFKPHEDQTAELKRMYVATERRGTGVGSALVKALEAWAVELGYTAIVLETGVRQEEAITLYRARGFGIIPSYGVYADMPLSVCMRKDIA